MSIGNTADYRFLVYWAHQRVVILIGQSLSHFVFAKVTPQQPNGRDNPPNRESNTFLNQNM
jgi:hypothetical protein